VLEVDATSHVVSYEEFHPYGTTALQLGRSGEVSLKRYRYTGMERDEETGLAYHTARYYSPWILRWLSCDPVGLGDGANVFRYSRCSPCTHSDPGGETVIVKENWARLQSGAAHHTTQADAETAFLRDLRAGLTAQEAQMFEIQTDANTNNRVLAFTGGSTSQLSEVARFWVAQVEATDQTFVTPVALGSSRAREIVRGTVSLTPFEISLSRQGAAVPGLRLAPNVQSIESGGNVGVSVDTGGGNVFVGYVTSANSGDVALVSPQMGRAIRGGNRTALGSYGYFRQSELSTTLIHEFAAHVEGFRRNERHVDSWNPGQFQLQHSVIGEVMAATDLPRVAELRLSQRSSSGPLIRAHHFERLVFQMVSQRFPGHVGPRGTRRERQIRVLQALERMLSQ
jgi:RHS repeat-associated protein